MFVLQIGPLTLIAALAETGYSWSVDEPVRLYDNCRVFSSDGYLVSHNQSGRTF